MISEHLTNALCSLWFREMQESHVEASVGAKRSMPMRKHRSPEAGYRCGDTRVGIEERRYSQPNACFLRRRPCVLCRPPTEGRRSRCGEDGGFTGREVTCEKADFEKPRQKKPVMTSTRRQCQMTHARNPKPLRCQNPGLVLSASARNCTVPACRERRAESPPILSREGWGTLVLTLQSANQAGSSTWAKRGSLTGCYPGTRIWRQDRSGGVPGASSRWPVRIVWHCTSARTQAV